MLLLLPPNKGAAGCAALAPGYCPLQYTTALSHASLFKWCWQKHEDKPENKVISPGRVQALPLRKRKGAGEQARPFRSQAWASAHPHWSVMFS